MSLRPLSLLLLLGLAGCAIGPSPSLRVSGAETRGPTDPPVVVPAGFVTTRDGAQMELVTADGILLTGSLRAEQQPVIVPLAASGAPLVGGGTDLVGQITAGGLAMDCRFRLLNPQRGMDGGGSGRCAGNGRTVDFLF